MTAIAVDCQVEHQMTIAVMRKGEPMSDLIKRLSELRSQYSCFDENERDAYHTLSEAIEALQVQKTGKWIESEQRDRTICSVCGYWQDLKAKFLFSFCPNCGSLMRGGYTNENISDWTEVRKNE